MPGSTTNLGLTLPTGGDAPSELRIAITNNANAMDAYSLLTSTVTNAGSASVLRGQSVIASPSTTQTLPAATANAMVAITASNTVTGAAPVTVAGSNIYGVGLSAAASFKLGTPGATAVLQSDGTNWFIVAGQQDTGWVALTLAGGVTALGGFYTPAARLQGDTVRLRGAALNSNGGAITTFATLPSSGLFPAKNIEIPMTLFLSTSAVSVQISLSTGLISTGSAGVPAGVDFGFDGMSYQVS